jgi:hypothetical protein
MSALIDLVELISGLAVSAAKAAKAKTEAEVAAALAELDAELERGRALVGRIRTELAAGDARVDAAADEKFKADGGNNVDGTR